MPVGDPTPTTRTMLWRGMRVRCPWCASRPSFMHGLLGRHERCPSCGIRWRREEGSELGSVTINMIATLMLVVIGIAVSVILTVPDIPVLPITVGLLVGACVAPVVLFRWSMTMWVAIELAAHRPTQAELAEAQAHVRA